VCGFVVVAVDSVVSLLEIVEGPEEVGVRCVGSRQFDQQISAVSLRTTRDGVPKVLIALWVSNEVVLLQGPRLVPVCRTDPGAFDYPVRSLLLWVPPEPLLLHGREESMVGVVGGSEGVVHVTAFSASKSGGNTTASVGCITEFARYRIGDTAIICHELEPHSSDGGGRGKGGRRNAPGVQTVQGRGGAEEWNEGGAVLLHSNRNAVLSVRYGRLAVLRVAFQERVKEMGALHTELMPHACVWVSHEDRLNFGAVKYFNTPPPSGRQRERANWWRQRRGEWWTRSSCGSRFVL